MSDIGNRPSFINPLTYISPKRGLKARIAHVLSTAAPSGPVQRWLLQWCEYRRMGWDTMWHFPIFLWKYSACQTAQRLIFQACSSHPRRTVMVTCQCMYWCPSIKSVLTFLLVDIEMGDGIQPYYMAWLPINIRVGLGVWVKLSVPDPSVLIHACFSVW